MYRLIALLFLLFASPAFAKNCPEVLADCPNLNANEGAFGGAVTALEGKNFGGVIYAAGYGVVGDGTTSNRLTPFAVVGLSSGVTAIHPGTQHTCAIQNGAARSDLVR